MLAKAEAKGDRMQDIKKMLQVQIDALDKNRGERAAQHYLEMKKLDRMIVRSNRHIKLWFALYGYIMLAMGAMGGFILGVWQ
jgi:hypothetical protein